MTQFALLQLGALVPGILISPLAGSLVDRWDRRRAMILADLGAGLAIAALAAVALGGPPPFLPVFALLCLASLFTAFQFPALAAATAMMVPAEQLGRANGLLQLADATSRIAAPLLGAVLLSAIGLAGVLLVDFATFIVSLATLLAVRFPVIARTERAESTPREPASLWADAMVAWRFLTARRGLLALLGLAAVGNFVMGTLQALLTPLVLGFTSRETLGVVLGVGSSGMLAGAAALAAWGGPRDRVRGILALTAGQGLLLLLGGVQPSAALVTAATFLFLAATPVVLGASQAIWQTKVPLELQGRAFALRRALALSSLPLAFLSAGPLADRVFEPLLAEGGPLTATLGAVIGTGAGRGIGLYLVLLGVFLLALALAGRMFRPLVEFEQALPDAVGNGPAGREVRPA